MNLHLKDRKKWDVSAKPQISLKKEMFKDMAYKSESIANILKRLKTQYFLPAIQSQFLSKDYSANRFYRQPISPNTGFPSTVQTRNRYHEM